MITLILRNGTHVILPTAIYQHTEEGVTSYFSDRFKEHWLASILPCGTLSLGTTECSIIPANVVSNMVMTPEPRGSFVPKKVTRFEIRKGKKIKSKTIK